MRFALWLIGLFGVAVAVALFAGSNPGTVTVFWPPYRIDLSLNLVLLLLLGAFVTVHLALRALAALFALPDKAQQWRAQQRERAAHRAWLEGLSHLIGGRFVHARQSASQALVRQSAREDDEGVVAAPSPHDMLLRCLSHWLIAESAHALRDGAARDAQLAQSLSFAAQPGVRVGLQLRAAQWEVDDGNVGAALARLDALPGGAGGRVLARRLRLVCWRRSGRPLAALDVARQLVRHCALPGAAGQRCLQSLALEAIASCTDSAQVRVLFDRLPPSDRAQPEIALAGAERLQELEGDLALARSWLLPIWDAVMAPDSAAGNEAMRLRLARTLVCANASGMTGFEPAWRERVETARRRSPRDPLLRYLAGLSCLQQPQLLPQAAQLLESAVSNLPDAQLRRVAWRALGVLAERRGEDACVFYKRAAEA